MNRGLNLSISLEGGQGALSYLALKCIAFAFRYHKQIISLSLIVIIRWWPVFISLNVWSSYIRLELERFKVYRCAFALDMVSFVKNEACLYKCEKPSCKNRVVQIANGTHN